MFDQCIGADVDNFVGTGVAVAVVDKGVTPKDAARNSGSAVIVVQVVVFNGGCTANT